MRRPSGLITLMVLSVSMMLMLSGCAGARLNKGAAKEKPLKPAERIAQLEQETKAKDQEIARVQQELAALQAREAAIRQASAYEPVTNVAVKPAASKGTGPVRVPGVTVEQVQRALKSAGYDPGPADGKFGAKTKEAVKKFQHHQGLTSDGVVGQKTWGALKRASGA